MQGTSVILSNTVEKIDVEERDLIDRKDSATIAIESSSSRVETAPPPQRPLASTRSPWPQIVMGDGAVRKRAIGELQSTIANDGTIWKVQKLNT